MLNNNSTNVLVGEDRNLSHEFVDDIVKGEYGEYKVKQMLAEHSLVADIEDKSGDRRYQKADIDMLVKFDEDSDEITSVEVKNDSSLFNNLFFESRSAIKSWTSDSPGCLLVTEADFLFYMYFALEIVVIVPVKELNKWVSNRMIEDGKAFRKVNPRNNGYSSEGYLVPMAQLTGKQYNVKGVPGLIIKDMKTNKVLSFDEYEERRKEVRKEVGTNYVKVTGEAGWRNANAELFKNEDRLQVELLDNDVRLSKANEKLAFLDMLYDR